MTDRPIRNLPTSIRQRLSQTAKTSGRPFQEIVQYYAMERLLYRLSQSPHAYEFVLKGGLEAHSLAGVVTRPTRDIDLLARMPNRIDDLVMVFRDVCGQDVEPDGLNFETASVQGKIIKEDADYEGVRVTFRGTLQNIPLPMQIDIGFGDVVFPTAALIEYPTILGHSAPKFRSYPRETTIAEKFEAMVKLGLLNSRMKDFYDIWILSRQFDFDGALLAEAIKKTFSHRGTIVTPTPTAFSEQFAKDVSKVAQWKGFLRKSLLNDTPEEFAVIVGMIVDFLSPVALAVQENRPFIQHWHAPGPWVND
ncbi:MAG TPA: nucleotidyl transferase AbiEii/AbiGii toxin family protein [Planctomicrobium sp.]|nr:nucleotidyl transferase AbiEii/AbiGii toxin family protein [Planctomicrobium sp.]